MQAIESGCGRVPIVAIRETCSVAEVRRRPAGQLPPVEFSISESDAERAGLFAFFQASESRTVKSMPPLRKVPNGAPLKK